MGQRFQGRKLSQVCVEEKRIQGTGRVVQTRGDPAIEEKNFAMGMVVSGGEGGEGEPILFKLARCVSREEKKSIQS